MHEHYVCRQLSNGRYPTHAAGGMSKVSPPVCNNVQSTLVVVFNRVSGGGDTHVQYYTMIVDL